MTAMTRPDVRLGALLEGFAKIPAHADPGIAGVAMNSNEIQPGFLFLACRGRRTHGLKHLGEALTRGATAVAWDPAGVQAEPHIPADVAGVAVAGLSQHVGEIAGRYFDEPSRHMAVIGITGTNGKTSCSQVLGQVLSEAGRPCGVIGTLGYGMYGALSPPTHTTPDPVLLQAELARLRAEGAVAVSMEVSSHALDQERVNGVRFAVAVFTNLTHEHLDYHGSIDRYGKAKSRLFGMPGLTHAVINLDDPFGREIADSLPGHVQQIGYSLEGRRGAALRARHLDLHSEGIRIQVSSPWGEGRINSRLLGRFNGANLLAVLGVLLALDLPFADCIEKLGRARTVPGRMERFGGGRGWPLVIVDYAHTPDALMKSLEASRTHCRGELWCVFGCGGERDTAKRPQMGSIAAELADHIVITDDNPRFESPEVIVRDIVRGIPAGIAVQIEHDRTRAVATALHAAAPADVILVAGKGHEEYQIVGNRPLAYSDRETVRLLLQELQA